MQPRDDVGHAHAMTGVPDVAKPNGVTQCRN
jgi:hypothetical protein